MGTHNKIIYVLGCIVLLGCKSGKDRQYQDLKGEVFGTYYRFQIDSDVDFSKQIDSVFKAVNKAVNTYSPSSEISMLNETGIHKDPSQTLLDMLRVAQGYYKKSGGYFNPAIYPLISEWKSGFHNNAEIDTSKVKQLLNLTVFDSIITIEPNEIRLLKKGARIDLSALGEGYTLDAIASILDNQKVENFILEIGGEMQCRGKNSKRKTWLVGIEAPNFNPSSVERTVLKTVQLKNCGLSTSGSYRKFYLDSLGNKHPHIIDPVTGFPVSHRLLSASVKSTSSATADALATACMAMGYERAKIFIENTPDIEGVLIVSKPNDSLISWSSNFFFK